MKIIHYSLFIILFSLLTFSCFPQKSDSVAKNKPVSVIAGDSIHIKKHSPKVATIMSAVIPGLGQAYNHKYWKIPIIYGGAAAIAYFVRFNSKNHKIWENEYSYRNSKSYKRSKDIDSNYTVQNIIDLENYYERDLELTYIIGGLVYILNILDAAVDANLFDYNMNNDLSLRLEPICFPSYYKNVNFAMKITFKFK